MNREALTVEKIKERIEYWEGESLNEDSCGKIEYYKEKLRQSKDGEL